MIRTIVLAAAAMLLGASVPTTNASSGADPAIRKALKLSDRERIATFDLNGDGKPEVIVYFNDPESCGTGGCDLGIFTHRGGRFDLVTNISITRLPIRVLPTSSHRWRDLGVVVGGGGIRRPYEARLMFDGKSYPENPTVLPAKPLTKAIGFVILK
jgi:hypothetical protein